jgi:hypothetical protein
MLIVGGAGPLLALGEPSAGAKLRYLLPTGGLLLGFAIVAFAPTLKTFRELKAHMLAPVTELEIERLKLEAEAAEESSGKDEQKQRDAGAQPPA